MSRSRWVLIALVFSSMAARCDVADVPTAKPFRVGVYIYSYRMKEAARDQNRPLGAFIDEHFKILSENGVNGVYLGGCGPADMDDYLAAAGRYGIGLIPQLDFAYFRGGWQEADLVANAKTAGEFIAKHGDRPEILAWSVKEETAHEQINNLARYYAMIRTHAPNAKFNLIHASLGAAQDQPVPDPEIIGTDRYGFWWEFSGGGYLASPGAALGWTRTQAAAFYPPAARRGADYMFVVTQGGMISVHSANTLCKTPDEMKYPKTPEARREMHKRVLPYANDNRMGWRKVTTAADDFYAVWKYYRLPENCLKACAWSAVLEGARLFFIWSYSPLTQAAMEAGNIDQLATDPKRRDFAWWTMAGRPGMPNRHLAELAEASREIRACEKIIMQMAKIPGLTVKTETGNTFGQAFHLPTRTGLVLVLHNANVGTWPENSRAFFRETDKIVINDEGDLVGYEPNRHPLAVTFSLDKELTGAAGTVEGLFDLATGSEIAAVNGRYSVAVKPGSGALVFLGTRKEAQRLHGWVAPGNKGQ